MCLPCLEFTECMTCCYVCLPFTDGALKGHFGMVYLGGPPLSVAVKLLCLQHVRVVVFEGMQEYGVSISVRCNDDTCLASLDPVRTYFTIPVSCYKLQCNATIHLKCHYTSLTSISFLGAIVFIFHPSFGFMLYVIQWNLSKIVSV